MDELSEGDRAWHSLLGAGTVIKLVPTGWPALTPIDQAVVRFDDFDQTCAIPLTRLERLS